MSWKAMTCQVIPSSFSTRVDGSLSIRMSTPELLSSEKAAFMELQNVPCEMMLRPLGIEDNETIVVDKDVAQKTASQRLRSVIFLLWKELGENGPFDAFYASQMEKIIDSVKRKLDSIKEHDENASSIEKSGSFRF